MPPRFLRDLTCTIVLALACCSAQKPPPSAASVAAELEPTSEANGRTLLHEILAWLNGASYDEATYQSRFTDAFRAQVPYGKLAEIVASLRGHDAWQETRVEEEGPKLIAHWKRGEQKLRVTLVPEGGDARRIAGLWFAPDVEDVARTAPEKAVESLQAMGTLALLVAKTTDGKCEPLAQRKAELSQPLGSAFKLWVLAAVVAQVRAGVLHWTDPVSIHDALDSLPSGVTQDDPDGSTRTLRELAERMIAISDNTATDHLIAHVGRSVVETALTETGHAHPEANRPFLSTREMMILKFGADGALRKDYLAGDEAARRKLLDTRVRAAPLPALDAVERQLAAGPTLIHEIEWLGSPLDLCRVLVVLTKDEAASKILALNPGVPAPPGRWTYLGYKGGSEAGVLTMAWEHEAASGERYVTAAALSNDGALIPEDKGAPLMAAIRDAVPKLDGVIESAAPKTAAP